MSVTMSAPFRDPLLLAHERIEALEDENERLEARLAEEASPRGEDLLRVAELEEQVRVLRERLASDRAVKREVTAFVGGAIAATIMMIALIALHS